MTTRNARDGRPLTVNEWEARARADLELPLTAHGLKVVYFALEHMLAGDFPSLEEVAEATQLLELMSALIGDCPDCKGSGCRTCHGWGSVPLGAGTGGAALFCAEGHMVTSSSAPAPIAGHGLCRKCGGVTRLYRFKELRRGTRP